MTLFTKCFWNAILVVWIFVPNHIFTFDRSFTKVACEALFMQCLALSWSRNGTCSAVQNECSVGRRFFGDHFLEISPTQVSFRHISSKSFHFLAFFYDCNIFYEINSSFLARIYWLFSFHTDGTFRIYNMLVTMLRWWQFYDVGARIFFVGDFFRLDGDLFNVKYR